ncbi:hypothetical protein [[Mycoplasma] gypis]|uniref:Lipoprotein n=1 Tax=[Mycoplasma] gypis TaxID=92404 RepID=A0ABZ2RPD2_9BACT|nr:hypothetical protein [[Mycoplasma] gypis]MBN0919025.1 hypothetical protein [[Mycoplasma] gypis]
MKKTKLGWASIAFLAATTVLATPLVAAQCNQNSKEVAEIKVTSESDLSKLNNDKKIENIATKLYDHVFALTIDSLKNDENWENSIRNISEFKVLDSKNNVHVIKEENIVDLLKDQLWHLHYLNDSFDKNSIITQIKLHLIRETVPSIIEENNDFYLILSTAVDYLISPKILSDLSSKEKVDNLVKVFTRVQNYFINLDIAIWDTVEKNKDENKRQELIAKVSLMYHKIATEITSKLGIEIEGLNNIISNSGHPVPNMKLILKIKNQKDFLTKLNALYNDIQNNKNFAFKFEKEINDLLKELK